MLVWDTKESAFREDYDLLRSAAATERGQQVERRLDLWDLSSPTHSTLYTIHRRGGSGSHALFWQRTLWYGRPWLRDVSNSTPVVPPSVNGWRGNAIDLFVLPLYTCAVFCPFCDQHLVRIKMKLHIFYRQLGCLALSLGFWPKIPKQLPSLKLDFFFQNSWF